tara:strand:- start:730 stop:1593 length:864 start_codon:yes stop_codon:yes gene_type:complete
MIKKLFLTFDIEHDYSSTYSFKGCDLFLEPVIDLLNSKGISATFFFSSDALLKYENLCEKIIKNGNAIGVHSSFHDFLCLFDINQQYEQIYVATKIHETLIGEKPKIFRAPNFSADSNTIKILEKLGYEIDSSVLPGRVHAMRPLKFINNFIQLRLPNFSKSIKPYIYDFSTAPKNIYNPSRKDICKVGNSKILELPVTKNLSDKRKGIPISGGSLQKYGFDNDLKSIEMSDTNPPVLVYHPWEFVKLENKELVFNEKLFSSLTKLIDACMNRYNFKTISLDNIMES